MLFIYYRIPTTRISGPGFIFLDSESTPEHVFIKVLLIKLIQISIILALNYEIGFREKIDRHFESRNSDLYANNTYIEFYHFYLQYKDYFAVSESLEHKCIFFSISVLKN